MVVETPPMSLGVIDDMWFRWVTDFGLPGPDRGEGGRYLLVPPGYKGELPQSGYFVCSRRPPWVQSGRPYSGPDCTAVTLAP